MQTALWQQGTAAALATNNTAIISLTASALSITPFTIMDMEYPRLGFVRVDSADRVLVDTLQGMRH
ncbi:hypothetical protein [Acidithiobacillus sp.]|uniref:hypothetical protein n=1 Tax=Acidithiobacillus sp. TaxID=1872118 RepID=UPI0035629CEB